MHEISNNTHVHTHTQVYTTLFSFLIDSCMRRVLIKSKTTESITEEDKTRQEGNKRKTTIKLIINQ